MKISIKKKSLIALFCGLSTLIYSSENKERKKLLEHLQDKSLAIAQSLHAYQDERVSKQYSSFCDTLFKSLQKEKINPLSALDILQTLEFANKKHGEINQRRKNKNKTPYIIHPIGVAENIIIFGETYDPNIIMAALLHDTVEDTQTTFEELEDKFSKTVADYVREVSDDKSLSKEERKQLQIVHAPHKSEGASIIKLGDFLYNLSDLQSNPPLEWSPERVNSYFTWALQVMNGLPYKNPGLSQAVALVFAQR